MPIRLQTLCISSRNLSPKYSDTDIGMCTPEGQQAKANSKAPFSVKTLCTLKCIAQKKTNTQQMDTQVIVNLTGLVKEALHHSILQHCVQCSWTYLMSMYKKNTQNQQDNPVIRRVYMSSLKYPVALYKDTRVFNKAATSLYSKKGKCRKGTSLYMWQFPETTF